LVASFATNLDRRLSGDASTEPVAELNGVSLVFAVLRERAARLFRRLSGKHGDGA
jgi:hypothetical protein